MKGITFGIIIVYCLRVAWITGTVKRLFHQLPYTFLVLFFSGHSVLSSLCSFTTVSSDSNFVSVNWLILEKDRRLLLNPSIVLLDIVHILLLRYKSLPMFSYASR